MTSYTAVGTSRQPSMTVSFKMDITTYGPHNGIFITSGIQQGTNGTAFAMTGQAPANVISAAPTVPAITEIPAQRAPSPDYGRDSPPDEFIKPEPIQINTFREQAPPTPVPYVQDPVDDLLLNDTTTTTTTVEVFRAKVDPNNPVDFFELPPNPNSVDPRPQLVRAAGLPYEVATRTDTRFSDRPTSGLGYVTPIPVYEESAQLVHPSRISWIDANTSGPAGYQTTILRRNHNNQHEGRLLSRAGSRPGSPTYSIGPESIAGGRAYSNADRYTPAPAPLRYTYSQPDVYAASTGGRENYYRHRHNGRRSKSPSSYCDAGRRSRSPGTYYEGGRRSRSPAQYYDGELPPMSELLRRSRSRSETRLDQIGNYNRPLSSMSALSNESFSNSVNNVFKLYETRDCLGNVIAQVDPGATSARTQTSTESLMAETSPRKEARRYDREMVGRKASEQVQKAKAAASGDRRVGFAKEPPVLRKSRTRSQSKSPRKAPSTTIPATVVATPGEAETPRSTTSGPTGFASRELAPEAPLCVPEVDDTTPRVAPTPVADDNVVFPPPPPKYTKLDENPPPPPYVFPAPTCLEAHDSVEPVSKTHSVSAENLSPSKLKPATFERVKLSESASEQLARFGYISPRKRITKFTGGQARPDRSSSTDRTTFATVEPTYIPSKLDKPPSLRKPRSTSVDPAAPMTRLNYDIGISGVKKDSIDDSWLPPPPPDLIPKNVPPSLQPRRTSTEPVVRNVPITHLSAEAIPKAGKQDVYSTLGPRKAKPVIPSTAPPAYSVSRATLSKSTDDVSKSGMASTSRVVETKVKEATVKAGSTEPSKKVDLDALSKKDSTMPPLSKPLYSNVPDASVLATFTHSKPQTSTSKPFSNAPSVPEHRSVPSSTASAQLPLTTAPTSVLESSKTFPTSKTSTTAPSSSTLPSANPILNIFQHSPSPSSSISSKPTYQIPPAPETKPSKQPSNASNLFHHTSPSDSSTSSSLPDPPVFPFSQPSTDNLNLFKPQQPTSTTPPMPSPSKPFYTIVPPAAPAHATPSPTPVITSFFKRPTTSTKPPTTAPLSTPLAPKPTFNSSLRASFTRKKPPLPPKRTTSINETTRLPSPTGSDASDVSFDSFLYGKSVFEQRNPIDPNVRVVAENSKLHFFDFLP